MRDWSKSSLKSLLEGCSWQWALSHIYGLSDYGSPATVMGTGFHTAVEMHERNRSDDMSFFQEAASSQVLKEAQSIPEFSWLRHNTTPDEAARMAAEAVRVWWQEPCRTAEGEGKSLREICLERDVIAVEPYFKVPVKGSSSSLHGYIDVVHRAGDEIIVTDYKTASSFRRWTFDQGESIEASVYLHGAKLSEFLPDGNIKFEWQVVSPKEGKSRLIQGPTYTKKHSKHVEDVVKKADVLYELDAYRPKPDWNLCHPKWCPFFQECQVDGTMSPTYLTVANKPVTSTAQD